MPDKDFPVDSVSPSARKKQVPDLTIENMVAIYTTLKILSEMRRKMGLEVMLEYISAYLLLIEKTTPVLKSAVGEAIKIVSLEKLYKDMVNNENAR